MGVIESVSCAQELHPSIQIHHIDNNKNLHTSQSIYIYTHTHTPRTHLWGSAREADYGWRRIMSKKRNQVLFTKPEDPKFLKFIKLQAGYRDESDIEAKVCKHKRAFSLGVVSLGSVYFCPSITTLWWQWWQSHRGVPDDYYTFRRKGWLLCVQLICTLISVIVCLVGFAQSAFAIAPTYSQFVCDVSRERCCHFGVPTFFFAHSHRHGLCMRLCVVSCPKADGSMQHWGYVERWLGRWLSVQTALQSWCVDCGCVF